MTDDHPKRELIPVDVDEIESTTNALREGPSVLINEGENVSHCIAKVQETPVLISDSLSARGPFVTLVAAQEVGVTVAFTENGWNIGLMITVMVPMLEAVIFRAPTVCSGMYADCTERPDDDDRI
jgi:hypothetical protein